MNGFTRVADCAQFQVHSVPLKKQHLQGNAKVRAWKLEARKRRLMPLSSMTCARGAAVSAGGAPPRLTRRNDAP
jgi:hypothetical protein